MKKLWYRIAAMTLAALMLLSFGACSDDQQNEDPGQWQTQGGEPGQQETAEKVWREALPVDASTLNPHTASLNYDGIVSDYCTGNLYREMPAKDRKSIELVPELAESEPEMQDEEGTVWNIKVRENVKWSNGDPINADTFIYSLKMGLDPALLNSRATMIANYFIEIENAFEYAMQAGEGQEAVAWEDVGIKKVDDYTLQIITTVSYSADDVMRHFNMRATKPVHEGLYEAGMNESRTATTYGTDLDSFVSCGPWTFTDWVKGAERTYTKNPDSPIADRVYFDKVIYRIVPDSGTRLQMFENGEIDYIELDMNTYPKYKEDPRLRVSKTVSIFHFEINRVNPDQPIFQDVEFRKALFYAMDRNTFGQLLYAEPAPYYVHHLAYVDPDKGILYRDLPEAQALVPENGGYDPELAKQYFDSAMERAGLDKIKVKMLIEDTGDVLKVMGEYMQQDMQKIFGEDRFEIEIVNMPDQQKTATMKAWATQPTGYEIGGHLFNNAATALYPYLIFRPYTKDYNTYSNYNNPEYDALYAKAESAEYRLDPEKKKEILLALEKEFLDDVMNLPTVEWVGYNLFAEWIVLPVDDFLPSQGYGVMFADVDTTKLP